jgi:CRISPR/Cas system-associated protein Cas10 (large subunit of type III CRISPR-Cas system)
MTRNKVECRPGWARCACCGRLFRLDASDKRRRHQKHCKNPACVLERSRRYKREYARRRYRSSRAIARMLNLQTTASRRRGKERKRAEAEAAALALAEKEALERKAAEEAGRVEMEKREQEERRHLQLLGLQAMLFGVNEAEDMERVSAKTLEAGMKWRHAMSGKESLSTFSLQGDWPSSGKAEASFERAPPGAARRPWGRNGL